MRGLPGADVLRLLPPERKGEYLLDILAMDPPSRVLRLLEEHDLLHPLYPELQALKGVDQRSLEYPDGVRNFHHKDVFFHTLRVLDNAGEMSEDVWIRLAALLHDVAKPRTKRFVEGVGWTFYGHAELGARMTHRLLKSYGYPKDKVALVATLVALHLRPIALVKEEVTDSAIRRLLTEAGEDIMELLVLCQADITSKNPTLVRRYMRNYEYLRTTIADLVGRDEVRLWQPALTGEAIMDRFSLSPGVVVGVLKILAEDAILLGRIPDTVEDALVYLESQVDAVKQGTITKEQIGVRKTLRRLPDFLRA